MIAAWMIWSFGAGALLLLAGFAAERLLTLYRRPTRWVWVVAGAGTILLPGLRIVGGGAAAEPNPGAVAFSLEPLAVTVAQNSTLRSLDDLLLTLWVALSFLLVVAALFAWARLVRLRSRWPSGTLRGRSVLWSGDLGPAVLGLFRPRIVMPGWVREVHSGHQDLILAHEEEHVRAGDSQLRFLAAVVVLAFPWNAALWVQYRRLGLAVELDCDRRVMDRLPGTRRQYGDLLLRVGARRSGLTGLAVAALAEQPSFLERRIRDLVRRAPEVRLAQAAFLIFAATAVAGFALLAPGIDSEQEDPDVDLPRTPVVEPPPPAVVSEAPAGLVEPPPPEKAEIEAGPTFTPFTVAPDIQNRSEIQEALEAEYPPLLRDAGIGGTVNVWFLIDETGTLVQTRVNTSSGHEALDQAALRVADRFRWTPALNRDEKVPVWIALDITFTTGERARSRDRPSRDPLTLEEVRPDPDRPSPTPFTTAPRMTNRDEVEGLIEQEYPPLLRDAGIEGTALVWLYVDEGGTLTDTRIDRSSGHAPLDDAALRVATRMRFEPALDGEVPVSVWVAIEIPFKRGT